VDRFRPLIPIENMLIVTNVLYKDMILEQIPDMDESQILCEPARRSTAPCIAYAMAVIKAKGEGRKANVVVAASDHLILEEEKFRQVISQAFDFTGKNEAICTLGMQPTRPETGYGYIQFEQKGDVCPVKQFREKPDLETAKRYVASGEYLWNSGIFIWNLETIDQAIKAYLPEVAAIFAKGEGIIGTEGERAFIDEYFPQCPNISVDYGIMEKAQNVYVLPSSFGWSDLGTWGSLYELSEKDAQQNVSLHCEAHFHEAEGNIVVLEQGKKAIIQGVNDLIVAEQDGALLICKKADEQHIKDWI